MSQRLTTASNLFEYFEARIDEARVATDVRVSDDAGLYLANLLTDRAHIDRAPVEGTLAELHMEASSKPPVEQIRAYRELGDRALYNLGYFEDSLRSGTVSPSYYTEMGAAAYLRVDDVFKRWFRDAFGPLFRELAGCFTACVTVLRAVRETHEGRDELALLYEEWLDTGSEDLARRLRARGLVLPRRTVPES